MPGVPDDHRVAALVSRAMNYNQLGMHKEATLDFTEVMGTTGGSAPLRSFAVLGRGLAYEALGEVVRAVDDYTLLLEQPDAPNIARENAHYFRGVLHCRRGEIEQGIADLEAAVQVPDCTNSSRASAFFFLGLAYGLQEKFGEAISAFTAASEISDVDAIDRARARSAAAWRTSHWRALTRRSRITQRSRKRQALPMISSLKPRTFVDWLTRSVGIAQVPSSTSPRWLNCNRPPSNRRLGLSLRGRLCMLRWAILKGLSQTPRP